MATQGGSSGQICIHDSKFRSDHACMIQNSETEWMHARGQPASARGWPAACGQLADGGWPVRAFYVPPIAFARARSLSIALDL